MIAIMCTVYFVVTCAIICFMWHYLEKQLDRIENTLKDLINKDDIKQ